MAPSGNGRPAPEAPFGLTTSEPHGRPHLTVLLRPLVGVLYAALVLGVVKHYGTTGISPVFWRVSYALLAVAILASYLLHRSVGLALDLVVGMLLTWWLFEGLKHGSVVLLYLPLITAVAISALPRHRSWIGQAFAWLLPLVWLALADPLSLRSGDFPQYGLVASAVVMLVLSALRCRPSLRKPLSNIDFVLCSYSGNTAHYSQQFVEGATAAGARVVLHRFHYYKSSAPIPSGDALAIAFPVFGGKPPWPFLNYLLLRLPRGRGKPAFILYTCIGGAENAGFLCWLLLTVRGYRVVGRNWSVYPLNVPTFRLGPRVLWKFLDSLVPSRTELQRQRACGADFAAGRATGIPFLFTPTPFSLVGMLVDNKWLDTILYRNHVVRKRCTGCGICVRYCPSERLTMAESYPRAAGECSLCMGCVNMCPTNAMHLWFWTEYGKQYPPRYGEFVVRGKGEGTARIGAEKAPPASPRARTP